MLTITPVLIVLASGRKSGQPRVLPLEVVAFAAALLATSLYCMGFLRVSTLIPVPMIALVPLLMWAVFRLGQRITFPAVLLVESLAILATVFSPAWN